MQLTDPIKLWSGETVTLSQLLAGVFGRVADLESLWAVGQAGVRDPGRLTTILDSTAQRVDGLTAAVSTLASAVASGRDDLTAEELTAAVDEGIRRGGAAILAAQEAARAANPTS